MSVKSRIEQLTLEQRRRLSLAFDAELSQFVEIGNSGKFVGVHLNFNKIKHLHPEEQVGVWSYGEIRT